MTPRKPARRGRQSTAGSGPFEQAFGIDARAARLFDVLLDVGRSTVQRLAQSARTERTGTYDVLNRLITRGLVETQAVGARTLYVAANPDAIRQQSAAHLERIDALMPELRSRYAKHASAPLVRSLDGGAGLTALIDRLTSDGTSELLIVAPNLALTDVFGALPGRTQPTSQSKKTTIRLVVGAAAVADGWRWLEPLASRVVVRRLHPAATVTVGEVLFDRAVAYVLTEGTPAISFIESTAVATHHRQLFELLWRSAKPL